MLPPIGHAPSASPQSVIAGIETFCRELRAAGGKPRLPLLVLRVPRLSRDLRVACSKALDETRVRTLRDCDLLGCDGGSKYLVALVSPSRDGISVATPTDCRATLLRLSGVIEETVSVHPDTGWMMINRSVAPGRLARAIDMALERGASERDRQAFLSSIGHELRTPLTSVRGYLETLLDEELDAETARRFLETARAEALRMGRLVDGLHEISVLDADVRQGAENDGELLAALAAALRAVGPIAADRRTVICQLVSRPCKVRLSTDHVTQILVNVLENAVKHGREAGRVFLSIANLDERYVEVRVDDDGPGVLPAERGAIFELARRGSNARARGNGIGLALVRLMLDRIGGEVDVTDSPGGGARFRLRIPVAGLGASGPAPKRRLRRLGARGLMDKARVF